MITSRDIVYGVVLPAVLTGLVVIAGRAFRGGAARASASLGVGLGFVAGFGALLGVPPARPLDSVDWLYYIAAVTAAAGALDAWLLAPRPSRWFERLVRTILVLAISTVVVWLLSRPLLIFAWTGWHGPLYIGGIALIMTIVWSSADALARRGGAMSLSLMFTVCAAMASATVMMSGSQKLGQIGGMLTAALGGLTVLSWSRSPDSGSPGASLIFCLLYVSLIAATSEHLYASLTNTNAALLLVAPACAWLGEVVPGRRTALRGLVRVGFAALPALIALTFAAIAFARSQSEFSDYGQ